MLNTVKWKFLHIVASRLFNKSCLEFFHLIYVALGKALVWIQNLFVQNIHEPF